MSKEPIQMMMDLGDANPSAISFDDLDDALVGTASQAMGVPLAVYDYDLIIRTLMLNNGFNYEEASEFADHNILCLWAGEGTPLIMHRRCDEE